MNFPTSALQWPPDGSDMAHVIRETDWQATSVGAIGTWPACLRTAVTTVLDAPLPTIVLWGQELLQIYNDAYRHVLGARHPLAMGQATRACWPEVWHFNAPIYARVIGSGERIHLEDQEYVIEPSGVPESRFFTITYAPARDESGCVRGVFVTAMDTTRRVLAERENARLLKEVASAHDQLRQMFDQAPSFMALLRGPEHTFELANENYQRDIGLEDVIGKTLREAMPDAQRQGFIALLDAAYATGNPFVASRMPFLMQRPAQGAAAQRYLDFVYKPLRDADGQVSSIFVEGKDVTEQYHQEQELARLNGELEEKVRRLEKAERRQKFQLDLAERLRPVVPQQDVASAACQLLGEFLGVSRVVFCEVDDANGTFFVRCEWIRGELKSVSNEVRPLDDFGADNIALLRAGQVFACDDTATDSRTAQFAAAYAKVDIIASLAIPLIQAGRFTTILNVQNTTPRHWSEDDIELARELAERTWSAAESTRAQAELRLERDQSQYIFENVAAGFGMIDPDGRVVYMNAEGLHLGQRSAAEVIGKNHWDVWPELRGSSTESVYRRVLASGTPETFEQEIALSPTSKSWREVRVHRTLGGELAIFYHDISDRKKIETTLTEVARHKDEFLAMLAHELRNPLSPICAAAELLSVATLDQARVHQISGVIKRQAAHMTSLIDDLLDVSRVTKGFVTLINEAHDVKRILLDAIEQTRSLLEARSHRLAVHLAPESTWVLGDRKRLVQVLGNLLNNAIKYTPEHGAIDLTLEATASQIVVSVTDDGIGMAPSLVARAFDLFSQAERSSDRVQGGLGIGLSLVKSLVELHGGSVAAFSAGLDAGSRFTITLPRLHEHDKSPLSSVLPAAPAPARVLTIMIVDDNVDAADMLALFLESAGHTVVVEYFPRKALERARIAPPDVCLLDLGLPEMDGNELARQLRLLPQMARAVLVAVTGYSQQEDKDMAFASGFHHHFAKPVDCDKLTALLDQISDAR